MPEPRPSRENEQQRTRRLRLAGKLEEFYGRFQQLKKDGMPPDVAWQQVLNEYATVGLEPAAMPSPIAEPALSAFDGKECSLSDAIQWVSERVFTTVTPMDAPSAAAWQMWRWANANPTDFFNKHVLATMPKQSDLAAAQARDESGSGIIEALEAVERSIAEAEQQA